MEKITDLILDFDGTCTQIPLIYEKFLRDYFAGLKAKLPTSQHVSQKQWDDALRLVMGKSPAAGWTVAATPSAPAAADPYVLAFEAARYVFRSQSPKIIFQIPAEVFTTAYTANAAPWREETLDVIKTMLANDVSIHLVTNSDKQAVTLRLQDLWGGGKLPDALSVIGSAAKFNITEPDWDSLEGMPKELCENFDHVPAVQPDTDMGRPLYLRRGSFFSAIASIFKSRPGNLATSIFCGDVWELDLALPAAMGANIHLIERAAPFNTYDYERNLTISRKHKGRISRDLNGLLEWLK